MEIFPHPVKKSQASTIYVFQIPYPLTVVMVLVLDQAAVGSIPYYQFLDNFLPEWFLQSCIEFLECFIAQFQLK